MSKLEENFVKEIASKQGVTKTELEVLLLALDENSGSQIAESLKISEAAVRKRLGESYRKFRIEGGGNKKLHHLKQRLLAEYQSQAENCQKSQDWGEAVDVEDFYGRDAQIAELESWIRGGAGTEYAANRCRLVAVLGMGGIGKTALAARIAKNVQSEFDYVIWRSLRNAPTLVDILADLLNFLPSLPEADLPDNENTRILRLITALRQHRCLIIFDNVEAVLRSGEGKPYERAGEYRAGYEGYGYLFKKIGEAQHQSCLLLTSREKPKEVAAIEGKSLPVKVLQLSGLTLLEAQIILKDKGCVVEGALLRELVERYSGNPLALKIVATTIYDLFGNNVSEFLEQINQETAVYGDIRTLLRDQFRRLSDLEKQVMYWLAINREYVTLTELKEDIIPSSSLRRLLEAIESLWRRSLIEREVNSGRLRQQSVVMEYVTEKAIEQFCADFTKGEMDFANSYPLIKARSLDYIRSSQQQHILQPVIRNLFSIYDRELDVHLRRLLSSLQAHPSKKGYAAGNLINLLCQLQSGQSRIDLSGRDFSDLTIWQADFKDVRLHNTSFANADVTGSVFAETMASLVSVAFSPDGAHFATGVGDGEVRLWQVDGNKQIQIYRGHTAWVWSLAFREESAHVPLLLASASADYTVRVWDVFTEECLYVLKGHTSKVYAVAFSPIAHGSILASGSQDCTIKLWDVTTGECLQTLRGHNNWVLSVAFSPTTPQLLASSSADGTIKLWDIATGKCTHSLNGHKGQVYSVVFSPNGKILASCGEDQTVKIWDLHTYQCLKTFCGHKQKVYSVRFSPDGQIIASSSEDRTIKLWDLNTGACRSSLTGHISQVWSIDFHPTGEMLISSSDDQTARLWDVNTGNQLNVLQGYTCAIYAVAFSPIPRNEGLLLATASDDHSVHLWDLNTGHCHSLRGHKGRIRGLAFSEQEPLLASGAGDGSVKIWDISEINHTKCLQTLRGHKNWVWGVDFSPDGQTLASCSEDRTLRLWDIRTGECLRVLEGHTHWVWTVAFNKNGQIASGSGDGTVKIWDVNTGKCLQTLTGHTDLVWSVAFSPDGQILASGSEDRTIKFWDLQTGKCLQTLEGHTQEVFSVVFSPDGRMLASGSGDRTVKLWQVSTGICQDTLKRGHTDRIRSVAFSPDGQTLASGSEDETVQLWDVQKCSRLKQIKSDRLYEGMEITGTTGLTDAQKASLKALGAIEVGEV